MTPLHASVGAAAAAVVVLLLRELRPVAVPFVLGLFFFYLADPLVKGLARRRVPRPAAITGVLLAGLAVLAGALSVVGRAGSVLAEDLPRYESKLESLAGKERLDKARQLSGASGERLAQAAAGLGALGGEALLVFAFTAFLLVEEPRSRKRWRRAFPKRADEIEKLVDGVEAEVVRFLWLQTAVSAGQALVFGLILAAYGVPLAGFWTLLNFISQYVPNLGPIASSVPPVLMALMESQPREAASLAALILASQFLIGNFIEPKVVGHGVSLDPISVLLGIVFLGWLWGLAGAFLAVPILLAVKEACSGVPALKPVAGLLQGTEDGH